MSVNRPPQPTATTPVLDARELAKWYRLGETRIHALHDVSLTVHDGEFVAVMGPSGSGKSTLLYLIGLLEPADGGSVHLGGADVAGMSDDELTILRRDRIGFVFQTFELIPNLTARENVLLPAEVAGRREEAARRLPDLAERLNITDRLEHRPAQLSGGQRQRVSLARALINEPLLVLADEPTGNLDTVTGGEVLELLRAGVRDQGWTVVMVTHDPNAAMVADRIVFLRDGKVAGEVETREERARERIARFAGV